MADTERLINKEQGDSIIDALEAIGGRLQEMYAVDDALSSTSEHPVQNKVVKTALDNKVDKVDGKGLSTNDYTNEEKALVATIPDKADADDVAGTQIVSGNPITLTDCAPINAEKLEVELEPKQDLHGYDFPWVGGVGKNKLPMTVDGIKAANTSGSWSVNVYTINGGTFAILTDNDGNVTGIKVNGTFSASTVLNMDSKVLSGNYVLNGCPTGGGSNTYRLDLRRTNGGDVYIDSGSGVEVNGINESVYGAIRIQSGYTASNITFYPMLRLSTETDPTFAPYSNICPITGYTECEVDDVGFNQWDEEWETGVISIQNGENVSGNGIRSKNYCKCQPNTSYYLYVGQSADYVFWYDKDNNFIEHVYADSSKVITAPSNAYYFKIRVDSISTYANNISINYPATDTDYHPHQSRTASVTFGQTVYGGTVDFKTGVVTVDSGIIASYNGETLPSTWISDRDVYAVGTTPTTGAQVCYKLAEPQTIQLTPQELKLIKQHNNLTTNGTTITLGYQPDNVIGEVKGEIEQHLEMPYLRILDNNVETPINNYRIYYHLISGAYTLVNMGEMLNHRFIFVEVVKNPSGGVNKKVLHSALIDPRTIDGFEYEMKASGNDTIWIESILDENKFNLSLRTTGGSYSDGDPTDYYVTIRMVD